MKSYKVGVIGTGMGSTVLEVNKFSDIRLEVIGVCSKSIKRAERYKSLFGLKYAFDDYRRLIEVDEIDIIAVFSPDHLHAEHCLEALRAEKNVICTKPLVTSLDDAKEIVKLVKEKKLKFLTGQTMRYDPQFSAMKKMFDDGDLGEPIVAEAHYVHDMRPVYKMTPWRLNIPQDFMYGGVCHPVDVLRWFMGDVEEVFAYGKRGGLTPEYSLIGNFILNLKFKNGVIGRILGIYDIVHPPMPMMGVSIFGPKGSAIGDFTDKSGGNVKVVLDKFDYKMESETNYPPEIEGAYGHGETVLRYLKHFQDCLDRDEKPDPDAEEGAKSIAVCSAAWESVKTGKPVKVFNEF